MNEVGGKWWEEGIVPHMQSCLGQEGSDQGIFYDLRKNLIKK